MTRIALGSARELTHPDCIRALVAEFLCTFFFVLVGVGSSMSTEKLHSNGINALFSVALAHALIVAVMISSGIHLAAGHLNPAVTLGLAVGGQITIFRSFLYWVLQLLASVAACYLLVYLTGGLGTPVHVLATGVGYLQGVIMEFLLTFSLLFTVYATIVDPRKGPASGLGPTLTGFVVGANILAGGLFSGGSMNPARSFGPALVSGIWTDHWVYWVGPLFGGGLAGYVYDEVFIGRSHEPLPTEEYPSA